MKKSFLVVIIILVMVSMATPTLAHPGRTDGSGGHFDHDTGEYHYHHGYPAHQHKNGECPYNHKDNTNHAIGSNSSSSSKSSNKDLLDKFLDENEKNEKDEATTSKKKIDWGTVIGIGVVSIIYGPYVIYMAFQLCKILVVGVIDWFSDKWRNRKK